MEEITDDKRDRGRQRRKRGDDIKYWSGNSSYGEVKRKTKIPGKM